jgi:hypothetical protein
VNHAKRRSDGGYDMWGYGIDACSEIKAAAINLPIVSVERTE